MRDICTQSNRDTYFTDMQVPWLTDCCCWEQMNPEGREILPQVAFSGFRQRYREPKMSEGFEDMTRVEFQVCYCFLLHVSVAYAVHVVFLLVSKHIVCRVLRAFVIFGQVG